MGTSAETQEPVGDIPSSHHHSAVSQQEDLGVLRTGGRAWLKSAESRKGLCSGSHLEDSPSVRRQSRAGWWCAACSLLFIKSRASPQDSATRIQDEPSHLNLQPRNCHRHTQRLSLHGSGLYQIDGFNHGVNGHVCFKEPGPSGQAGRLILGS